MKFYGLRERFYGLVILTCILTTGLFFYNIKALKMLSVILIFVFFLIPVGKLLSRYIYWFTQYMFNKEITDYNKHIEKPRLLFHLVFGSLIVLTLIGYQNFSLNAKVILGFDINILGFLVLNILSATSIFFIWNTWNTQFKNTIIPSVESNLKEGFRPDFKSDKKELEKIYDSAYRKKQITNSKEEFFAFIGGNNKTKINWIEKTVKSKQVSNITLLDFIEDISETTIDGFVGRQRKSLMTFIKNNFVKDGKTPNKKGMNNTYSTWSPKRIGRKSILK